MSTDVEKLLNKKGIHYHTKGNDALVLCLNPEHEDTSPSMRIDKTSGKYNCFSCGFGGQNIFEYFNEYFNPVNRQALEIRQRIQNINLEVTGLQLPDGIEMYMGDYRGIHPKLYKQFNVFQHPDYGDRLCFPITDSRGRISNIVARNMFTKLPPKYKMYPEGRAVPIYPRVSGTYVILVEGIFDVLNLVKHGVNNVAAIFGSKSISHSNVLDKFLPLTLSGIQDVILLLDNDAAGNHAAISLKKLIEYRTSLRVHIMNDRLPVGSDPGEISEEDCRFLEEEINKVLF